MSVSSSAHEASIIFGLDPLLIATVILVITYAGIISEKVNRAIIALLGAGIMVLSGVLTQDQAINGIDFNTIALLTGMMVVVAITRRTGVFEYVAIWSAKRVRGSPRALLMVLAAITAVFSALLDNVTTVLLIVPVTLLICEQLKLPSYPYLFSQIFASNIGGMATLIGDPPNILIGSAVGFSFMDFVVNVGPAALIIMLMMFGVFEIIWGRKLITTDKAIGHLMNYNEKKAIKDYRLLYKCIGCLVLILGGFIFGHPLGIEPGTTALTGAAILLLLDNIMFDPEKQTHHVHKTFNEVEWVTIFFFIGLFVVVYGVEETGLLKIFADYLTSMTEGNLTATSLVVLWSSAIISAIVDNIPFVATMIPVIKSMAPAVGGPEALEPVWWSLSLGACLGGNGSLIGASANLTVAGFAERAGQRIGFKQFLLLAFPLMLLSILVANIYLYLVFLI